ncbi:NlpC/P60 family protein [Streptomyces prasinopilosus]|uniref:NlpC/P60 family protein n=1 Tax=Streptomyces prasinopilosus TaxID=67344 RepID=UPI000ADE7AB6|nr:NlpC/P60 family protein [Streptomyces prasinopilosus]
MAVYTVDDGQMLYQPPPTTLTTQTLTGPARLQVSDAQGVLATLTIGARTVAIRGPQRTFTETKRPHVDSFDRTTTSGWGVSPAGGNWSNSNGTDADYTVSSGTGIINMTAVNASRHTSLVDDITDLDARLSWSLDKTPTGNASSLALSFAYTSSTSQYRARMSVLTTGAVQLILECQTPSGTTTIGAATQLGTGYVVGDVWHIRAQRIGTTIRCRAWKDGTPEPTTWTHEVVDATLGAGRIGVRGIATTGSTAIPFQFKVHDLQLYSGTWPDPPVITHSTWVRVLPTPFDGTWTPALADQIRRWAVDSSPDVLAYALMYVTGAPAVTSPALAGAQIVGESKYGPDDVDGTRMEGADFHEYMGLPWTFVSGETVPAPDPKWQKSLDCSGFVRMVYGYQMGIPMVRDQAINGLNLPRRTRDIGPNGPGIIVAQATGTAPPLTNMQIGDVPHFDATTEATAGEMDHNGIYLGVDTAGHPRFINSRKTPNGPTFGDLGGSSALDGTGLYATSLRLIRRF